MRSPDNSQPSICRDMKLSLRPMDKAHIHSHIVSNSVNAVTGKMYHSTRENYYKQIRGVSDRLCKAHGLSIVLENDEKKAASYAEWLRQKRASRRSALCSKRTLHDAIEDANDLGHFSFLWSIKAMRSITANALDFGCAGRNISCARERRNPTFSEERIEQAILGNLEQIEVGRKPVFTPKPKLQPYHPHPKYTGFLALYLHYCYCSVGSKTAVPAAAHDAAPAKRDHEG